MPQGSILGSLLFLIYKNYLLNGLTCVCERFVDNTSIFSEVFDKNNFQTDLNNKLCIISEWEFQWKMQFNPDPNKQANEVYFSRKLNTDDDIPIKLNDSPDSTV